MSESPARKVGSTETDAVRARYDRRNAAGGGDRYNPLNASVWQAFFERQRAMLRLFASLGRDSVTNTKLLEVGCGAGGNLLDFLRLGFQPENVIGIELLEDRATRARRVLPPGVVRVGDAATADVGLGTQDIVFQSVVFSSLLDPVFQQKLATRMWSWVRPGGGVLWYDFTYDNPRNPDVKGVPAKRIRQLFPRGELTLKRVTLAPPISRRVCAVHPGLYTVFNAFPFLRTHVLCWIQKA